MTPESHRSRTSFVIASRDRRSELTSVVSRLLDTTTCPIVVVDNGSADDSVAAVTRLAATAAGRLEIVALDDNLGAVARNVGVRRCGTEFVAFCDDDSWWEPESTGRAEEIFDGYPSVALLAGRMTVWPGERDDPVVAALATSPLGHDPALPGPSILGFLSCGSMVRSAAFLAVGGFSPILHFRGEESLVAWDLAAAGRQLCFTPELVAHHQPSSIRQTSAAQAARVLRNEALTTWLRRPADRCAEVTARLVRAAASDGEHTRALGEALRRLPAVARGRRRLPDHVERGLRILERADETG